MKFLIKKFLSLGLCNIFDIQFSNMLITSIFSSKIQNHLQNKQKSALILASTYLNANIRLGHSCLPLSLLTPEKLFQGNYPELTNEIFKKIGKLSINGWKDLLLSTPAVSNGTQISPLVLDNECLYLHRMWQDECAIAQFFNCSYNNFNITQEKKIIDILNKIFPKTCSTSINWHKVATAIGITHSRVIISGGPGTGKTSLIHKIITALLLYNNNLRIKLAAPTGKAAAVLTHSCQSILHNLNKLNNSIKYIKIPKATTLHSLLGSRLYKKKDINNNSDLDLLDIDYLIIDEASMMSLFVLSKLISALPSQIKIIFLGDHNQLYSIEPGSVFQDICKFYKIHYSPYQQKQLFRLTGYILPTTKNSVLKKDYNHITDSICLLKKNYRFDENSGIGQLADAIQLGDYNRSLSILNTNIYKDLHYIHFEKTEHYITMITNCAIKYNKYLKMLLQYKTSTIIDILKIFNHYRILCALRHGPFGVITLNYYIEQILNHKKLIKLNDSGNYIGKPIMILHNDPTLELYNGDIGILLPNNQNHLSAYFLMPDNKIKIVHIYQLPIYETCFAMTIHKSQGSEFQCTSIILPNRYVPILTKELLYTAITRTHKQLFLYSKDDVLIRSINCTTNRYSGLYNKINKISKNFNLP